MTRPEMSILYGSPMSKLVRMPSIQRSWRDMFAGQKQRLVALESPASGELPLAPMPALSRIYLSFLVLVGVALVFVQAPSLRGDWMLLAVLLAADVATERFPISVYGETVVSVGFVLTVAMIILFGAPAVVIAAPLEALAGRVGRKPLDTKVVTNAALFVVVYSAAAGSYRLFAETNPSSISAGVLAGAAVATAVCFFLSALLLSVSMRLRSGQPIAASWQRHRWLAPHYVGLGLVGVALSAAYVGLGVLGIVAFLTPAFMMRLGIKQYVDKTAENVELLKAQNAALERANVEVRRVSEDLRQTYDGTLEALVTALDARDQETKGHSIRVARYMLTIAEAIGVKRDTQQWLDMQRGALLHDVGKIGVPDGVLLKPAKLTDEEWELMRRHPEIGYRMLKEVKFLSGAAEIVLAHHERWDGKGYPNKLHAEEIPIGSRIFMVVDTFDSMTSDRPYRRALSVQEALDEIVRCSATQFDPLVVEAFLDIYPKWVLEKEKLALEVMRAA